MKLRNKLIGLVVAIVMIVATVGLNPVIAQAANAEVKLVPQKTEINAGETVVVEVQLSGNTGMIGLILNYTYDESAFEFVSATDGGVLNEWVNPQVGTLMWKDSLATINNTANGTIAKLIFTAKTGVEGTFGFGLSVKNCVDCNLSKVTLAATGTEAKIAHTHVYGEWSETLAPTCGANGEETRVCDCGEKATRPIAATGDHVYGEWTETTSPGCKTAGVKEKLCACGDKITVEIPAKGHEDSDENNICDVCDTDIKKEVIEESQANSKEDGKEYNKSDNKNDGKVNQKENNAKRVTIPLISVVVVIIAIGIVFYKKRMKKNN